MLDVQYSAVDGCRLSGTPAQSRPRVFLESWHQRSGHLFFTVRVVHLHSYPTRETGVLGVEWLGSAGGVDGVASAGISIE